MEYVNSTVSGNIESIIRLLAQAGIKDLTETHDQNMPDISKYVVPFHGDLGTGEHIQALLQCWAMENSPWRRCQYVVFVLGLFHLKMAVADVIWCTFIYPVTAKGDNTSLLHDVGILRPTEIGHYQSKPGFQCMHQLITYSGVCWRLNCWLELLKTKDPQIQSLETFVAMEPTFTQLKELAGILAQDFVKTCTIIRTCWKLSGRWDMQYKNALILNKYLLLYEELTHAMNSGDIGHTETCIVAWILVFKATGKNKYANHMTDLLMNLHFVYPEGLWYVYCYNITELLMSINPDMLSITWSWSTQLERRGNSMLLIGVWNWTTCSQRS